MLHHLLRRGRHRRRRACGRPCPHYVAAAPNPKAALSLIRSFEGVAQVAVEARALEESAEDYERQVNAAVATDPDVKAFVERLEQTLDEHRGRHARPHSPAPTRSRATSSASCASAARRSGPDEP